MLDWRHVLCIKIYHRADTQIRRLLDNGSFHH